MEHRTPGRMGRRRRSYRDKPGSAVVSEAGPGSASQVLWNVKNGKESSLRGRQYSSGGFLSFLL
jgi:hypothetical protein